MTQVVQDYVEGRTPFVNMVTPAQLNETILFDEQTYILDVRPVRRPEKVQRLAEFS